MKRIKVYHGVESKDYQDIVNGEREGVIETLRDGDAFKQVAYSYEWQFEFGDILYAEEHGMIYIVSFKSYVEDVEKILYTTMVSIDKEKGTWKLFKNDTCLKSNFKEASEKHINIFNNIILSNNKSGFFSYFKPFDKVVARYGEEDEWRASIFSHKKENMYVCIGACFSECLLYNESTANLIGTKKNYEYENKESEGFFQWDSILS